MEVRNTKFCKTITYTYMCSAYFVAANRHKIIDFVALDSLTIEYSNKLQWKDTKMESKRNEQNHMYDVYIQSRFSLLESVLLWLYFAKP